MPAGIGAPPPGSCWLAGFRQARSRAALRRLVRRVAGVLRSLWLAVDLREFLGSGSLSILESSRLRAAAPSVTRWLAERPVACSVIMAVLRAEV